MSSWIKTKWISWTNWRRQWHPTPVLLPGKSHGWRNLEGCSPWGRWGSDTTERLHFHFSLSCVGEGNGNPLQCSCLENPRDGGAWWAAVYGVVQSWTQLKWLSSSSNMINSGYMCKQSDKCVPKNSAPCLSPKHSKTNLLNIIKLYKGTLIFLFVIHTVKHRRYSKRSLFSKFSISCRGSSLNQNSFSFSSPKESEIWCHPMDD